MIRYQFVSPRDVRHSVISGVNSLLSQLDQNIPAVNLAIVRKIARFNHLLFATDSSNNRLVGLSILTVSHKLAAPDFGAIEDVIVDSTYRGRGIGKNLVLKLITKARQLKLSHIDLTSNPSRTLANQLYHSLGFTLRSSNPYRLLLK